ncbi:MAG: hypothetical protein EPN22_12010 [Nitrospirae bacterium]|nr:MAG: hypothetical protein EPN22_12010 [Nitrospirota bacterium]
MLRGGSWNNNARNVRAVNRNNNTPDNRNNNLGFRLASTHHHSKREPLRLRMHGQCAMCPDRCPARRGQPPIPFVKRECRQKTQRRAGLVGLKPKAL